MPSLTWKDVFVSWLLMAGPLALCFSWDRSTGRAWLIASLRSLLQLVALGYVLAFLFREQNWVLGLMALLAMVAVSAWTVRERSTVRYPQIFRDTLFCLCLSLLAVLLPVFFLMDKALVEKVDALLPFVGILLGNSVSGLSLFLSQWLRDLRHRKQELEFWLSLGATPEEARRSVKTAAIRTGLTTILNAMAVAGVVSIPGMMTGQLLAGGSPDMAVKYQLIVIYLIAALVFISCALLLRVSQMRVFDRWGNLHSEFLEEAK
jgi:putative ABC transport system permease protein